MIMLSRETRSRIQSKVAQKELADFIYHAERLTLLWERMEEFAHRLSYPLSSPKIKSEEEAKYQTGTRVYHDSAIELMYEEEKLYQEYLIMQQRVSRVARFLQTRNVKEVELLYYVCELKWSIAASAKQMNLSKRQALRILRKIYRDLCDF